MSENEVMKVTKAELRKLKVIEQVLEKRLKQKRAGQLLDLSVRQIIRLVKRVRRDGAKGIVHKLRGQESNRRHEERHREKIMKLCRKVYAGFGPTLAQEKLEERDKLYVNRETLRQWLMGEGLWEVSKKGCKHRKWRERKGCCGEMIQVDGSHHDWLEGRGPKLVLMGYIDDASSEVYCRFYDYEGTLPAMGSFLGYAKRYGLPHSLYLDRLKAYKGGGGKLSVEAELEGQTRVLSQFERALEALGVAVIHAQSAPAKGRIERLFKTFQDRVIKEMRLDGIKNKAEANRFLVSYLPKYNRRFGVKAREEANVHRDAPSHQELMETLSIQNQRVVRKDGTIRHDKKLYQLLRLDGGKSITKVMIQERLDGKLYVVHEGKSLKYRELQEAPKRDSTKKKKVTQKRTIPAMSHPWKGPSYERTQKQRRAASLAA